MQEINSYINMARNYAHIGGILQCKENRFLCLPDVKQSGKRA
jgi:hypothetical protein